MVPPPPAQLAWRACHVRPETGSASHCCSEFPGNRTVTVVPCPTILCSSMVPWWASTMAFTMANPRPKCPSERPLALSAR
jgi:hypothetical protein